MIRTLVIATMLVAAGPALAKDKTIRGCTGAGFAGCATMQLGKDTVMLIGKPSAVLPPPKTFVIATGGSRPRGAECLPRHAEDAREQDRPHAARVQIRS